MSTMPVSCCAVGCANRFSKESDIKVYHFPEEQGRRQLWVNAISRAKWELKGHHRLCGEHFVSRRPSKDVDYVPTVFKDGKRRRVTTKTSGREERAAKRAKNGDEAQEAASILLELSVSVASPSKHDSHYCEANTNTDVSFIMLEDEIAAGHLCKTFLVVSLWHCYTLDAPM